MHPSISLEGGRDQNLHLFQIERFADNSGYRALLSIRSGSFGLFEHAFYFEALDQFLEDLKNVYSALAGSAVLKTAYEKSHIEVAATSLGHIQVSGLVQEHGSQSQEVRFGFTIDQTFLPDFIATVEAAAYATRRAA